MAMHMYYARSVMGTEQASATHYDDTAQDDIGSVLVCRHMCTYRTVICLCRFMNTSNWLMIGDEEYPMNERIIRIIYIAAFMASNRS